MSESESDRGNPIQVIVVVLLLVGGGWYFSRHYRIEGLDAISINAKNAAADDQTYVSYRDVPAMLQSDRRPGTSEPADADRPENPFTSILASRGREKSTTVTSAQREFGNLKVASWALDGFGPTKLANSLARQNVARVIRQFDVVALQQIASIERDLVPRLVDAINQSEGRYDFVIGEPTGPSDRPEQLAFIFDTTRVVVDRHQTYTVEDPDDQVTFDPLVAWFRAAQPDVSRAWTFSLVNIRVDLARAPAEVALLPGMMAAIRNDGRGEDDIVLVGLFQADDAYLLPTMDGEQVRAAVRSRPTDIFGKYQTSNLLVDTATTSESVGRGGVFDYLRLYNLNLTEAETVTSHLPVFAEFTATEGGRLQ
jgi:hypothetical protein